MSISFTKEEKELIDGNKGFYFSRGFSDDMSFIQRRFGEEGEKKIRDNMSELGYDIDGAEKKESLPLAFYIAFIVLSRKIFNLSDEEMRQMGKESAKTSFIVKFASRFLVSVNMLCNNAGGVWSRYHKGTGDFRIAELDEEGKKIVGEISNFKGHPDYCLHLEGFFGQLIFFVTGKEGRCYEEKCALKGEGDVHRFVITWG